MLFWDRAFAAHCGRRRLSSSGGLLSEICAHNANLERNVGANVDGEYRRYELPQTDGEHTSFNGVLIARVSSRVPGRRKKHQRWKEIEIYRRDDGCYVLHEIGQSQVPGEVVWHTVTVRSTGADVLSTLEKPGTKKSGDLMVIATEVLEQASQNDAEFGKSLRDRHEVLDLAGASDGPGDEHVVARDGFRALRFRGRLIARESSRLENAAEWMEVAIYAAANGRYVIHKTMRSAELDVPKLATAYIVDDGIAALKALSGRGQGWVRETSIRAIEAAAKNDTRFGSTVRDALESGDWQRIAGDLPSFRGRDARRTVLEVMDQGARLLTSIESEPFVIRWSDEAPQAMRPPAPYVFAALSRQLLIQRVRIPDVSALCSMEQWEISATGREALRRSLADDSDSIVAAPSRE